MCRTRIKQTGQHVEDALINLVAWGNRENIIITSMSIDKNAFTLLKSHKGLKNTPESFELHTHFNTIKIHSN